jgi:hypothetical protein
MIARVRLPILSVASAACLALAACASRPPLAPPGAPPALRVAKNEALALEAFASGVQLYECAPSGQWRAKGAQAELVDRDGRKVGVVAPGPTWEARDGGKVTGELQAREPGRTGEDLDWALFRASSAPRGGLFGRASSVQRMDTAGGRAPAGECAQGAQARVPYRATYYFYRRGK